MGVGVTLYKLQCVHVCVLCMCVCMCGCAKCVSWGERCNYKFYDKHACIHHVLSFYANIHCSTVVMTLFDVSCVCMLLVLHISLYCIAHVYKSVSLLFFKMQCIFDVHVCMCVYACEHANIFTALWNL